MRIKEKIMIFEIKDTGKAASLFGEWKETLIWSCLQGIMGKVYADDRYHPTAAMALLGDFAFFAGRPSTELVSFKPDILTQNFILMVPQDEHWKRTILQHYGDRAKTVSRYATKKEPHIFDTAKLENAVASLPGQYGIFMIDEDLYQKCRASTWSADLVAQFPGYENFRSLGIGVVICKDNEIVSGASSYSRYKDGIEIQIDTREDCRRKGLAYVCGAKLILECLKRNLYPSWDAQNRGSLALAEKLGYHYSHTYTAVEIRDY